MRLTAFTDYSLRVLMYMATAPDGRATIGEIARAFRISENHLVKVVHRLGQIGVLVNTRGRGGGLRLAASPAAISLGRVVRETETQDVPAECFEPHANGCVIASACSLRNVLKEAVDAFYASLDRYTVADLVRKPSPVILNLHHPVPA
ncbi:MAG TPA: Rrf2 family transcriptional regulator [Usitatibacter sp.]|nr:Rrf2 family transcriptional regulator [Usitatibacter sp.]